MIRLGNMRRLGWMGAALGALAAATLAYAGVPTFKAGKVVTRSVIRGPSGAPILAEFDAQGNVVEVIGEQVGALEGSFVMSGAAYRQYIAAYDTFIAANKKGSAEGAYVLTRKEYESTNFVTVNGLAVPKPPLFASTLSVLVRHRSKLLTPQTPLVLLESGIDLRNRVVLAEATNAVLLDREGRVLRQAPVNIGYRVAFFSDPTTYVTDATNDDRIIRRAGDIAWGPVVGAGIEVTLDMRARAASGGDGSYGIIYEMPGCPGFQFEYTHNLIAQIYFRSFNPKSSMPWASYYQSMQVYDFCSELSKAFTGGTLLGAMSQINAGAIEATTATPLLRADIRVDVSVITGQGALLAVDGLVPLGDVTRYEAVTPPTLPGYNPASLRLPHATLDLSAKGLLQQISPADLEKTDLYVYRMSNGQLITQRNGLRRDEYIPYNDQGTSENEFFYKMLIRGRRANDLLTGDLEAYQEKTQVNPKLIGQNVDFLRAGELIKVIAINRPTGYIGTAVAQVQLAAGAIDFPIPPLMLMPPNLKVKAERMWEVAAGATAGKERRDIIGFEGAGLVSDNVIAISTEWLDQDNTPLPDDLEGYTGRLAKVVAPERLQAVGGVATFEIKPGTRLQVVQLPDEAAADHYYVHIAGEPMDRNPDFSAVGAGGGALSTRPAHYVPFRVPVFVEALTAEQTEAHIQQLALGWTPGGEKPKVENLERFYAWPYRPEMQFSLYDLELRAIDIVDDFGSGNPTSVDVFYDLDSGDQNPLANLGPAGQMVMALGIEETAVSTGENNLAIFQEGASYAVAVNQLSPTDYLALQLYKSNDVANALYEYVGLPLAVMAPRQAMLSRTYQQGAWNAAQSNAGDQDITDTYQMFDFLLIDEASVEVRVLDPARNPRGVLVPKTHLAADKHFFLVTYDDLEGMGFNRSSGREFVLHIAIESLPPSGLTPSAEPLRSQSIYIPGKLKEGHDGTMFGQVMQHDVLIQEGSLHLSRQDLSLTGLGPQLSLTRTYNNRDARREGVLGPGWNHTMGATLTAMAWDDPTAQTEFNLPSWVPPLRGGYFSADDVPSEDQPLKMLAVSTGGMFKKVDETWYAQRGQHGRIVETASGYDYVTKDGLVYHFGEPKREPLDVEAIKRVTMKLKDQLAMRLGIDPFVYVLEPGRMELSGMLPAQPQHVSSIGDRNGNELTFTYEEVRDSRGAAVPRITHVEDAVGRVMELTYEELDGIDSPRLTRVSVEAAGIEVVYSYDDEGYLASARRAYQVEHYRYVKQEDSDLYNLAEVEDGLSRTTTYSYLPVADVPANLTTLVRGLDPADVIGAVRYADDAIITFTYDVATANKRVITDARGNATTYTLNAQGNPILIEEPLNRTTAMTWSMDQGLDDNNMTSRTDALSRTTFYEYDDLGNVTRETDARGMETVRTYNEFSQVTSVTDRNGHTKSNGYDSQGNLLTESDAAGKTIVHSYNGVGQRESTTDRNGNVTRFSYGTYGHLAGETLGSASTSYAHDARGRLLGVIDARGNSRRFEYDELDRMTADIDAAGYRVTTVYDVVGNKIREVSKGGMVLVHTYDARNRLWTTTRQSDQATKSFTYDKNGNLETETDWKGRVTTYTNDALNQRTHVRSRLGDTMSLDYDEVGNVVSMTDVAGFVTTYEYDEIDRVFKTTDAEDGITLLGYDNEESVRTRTDPNNHVTTRVLDARDLLEREIDAANNPEIYGYDDNGNLITKTDREARIWRYEYDDHNRRTKLIAPDLGETTTDYDDAGNVTLEIDAEGRETLHTYNELNQLVETLDAEGGLTLRTYTPEGLLATITDARGFVSERSYDDRGNLVRTIDRTGGIEHRDYDQNGNLIRITDARGTVTFMVYDEQDRLVELTRAQGTPIEQVVRMTYDPNNNVKTITNPRTYTTLFDYDRLNRQIKRTDARGYEVVTTYDGVGNVKTLRDERNYVTQLDYDELDRLVLRIDAEGNETSYTYDRVGNRLTETDGRDHVTVNTYDELNRLRTSTKEGIVVSRTTYDKVGNVRTQTDGRDNVTTMTYDGLNRPIRIDYADTTFVLRSYDALGNLETETDERGVVIATNTYDGEGRLLTATNADGETATFVYDKAGQQTRAIRPLGDMSRFTYDALGRLTRVEDAAGITMYGYDEADNLSSVTDAKGNVTLFAYDELNRRTQLVERKPSGNLTTLYVYDPAGNVAETLQPSGERIVSTFDRKNREVTRTYPALTSSFRAPRATTFGYDGADNLELVRETKFDALLGADVTEETTMSYDPLARLTATTQRGVSTTVTYDGAGNRETVTLGGRTTTYTYDARNRLKTVLADGEAVGTTYDYRPDGEISRVAQPPFETLYGYDDAKRLTSVVNQTGGAVPAVFSSYDYTYDDNGNRLTAHEEQAGMPYQDIDYVYDGANRLAAVTTDVGGQVTTTLYELDATGNRARELIDNGTTVVQRAYEYDSSQWLVRLREGGANVDFVYDDDGNLVSKLDGRVATSTLLEYDARDRLVRVAEGAAGAEATAGLYDYDERGMRTQQRTSSRGDVEYFYLGRKLLEERAVGSGALIAHYRHGDRVLRADTSAGARFYAHDGQLSVVNLVTPSGTVDVGYRMDPWGKVTDFEGNASTFNRMTYTGHVADDDTGLVYMASRYYDPALGRFISEDDWTADLRRPITINRYLYANASPAMYVDEDGRFAFPLIMGLINVGIGAALHWLTAGEGESYSWGHAAVDFVAGATGTAVASRIAKLPHLGLLTDAIIGVTAEGIKKTAVEGKDFGLKEAGQGMLFQMGAGIALRKFFGGRQDALAKAKAAPGAGKPGLTAEASASRVAKPINEAPAHVQQELLRTKELSKLELKDLAGVAGYRHHAKTDVIDLIGGSGVQRVGADARAWVTKDANAGVMSTTSLFKNPFKKKAASESSEMGQIIYSKNLDGKFGMFGKKEGEADPVGALAYIKSLGRGVASQGGLWSVWKHLAGQRVSSKAGHDVVFKEAYELTVKDDNGKSMKVIYVVNAELERITDWPRYVDSMTRAATRLATVDGGIAVLGFAAVELNFRDDPWTTAVLSKVADCFGKPDPASAPAKRGNDPAACGGPNRGCTPAR